MKRRKNSKIMLGLLIAVIALGVGYAAISGVNLLINGSASITANGDFKVRFVKPLSSETAIDNPVDNAITISGHNADESAMDVSEMSASVTDDTHATFAVGALDTVGEYVDFTYTVVNESDEGIDAALSLEVADENDLADYFEITKSVGKNKIAPNETTTVTVTVKLIGQPKVNDAEATFKITLTATPVDESSESGSGTGGSEPQTSGPTMIAAQAGETHKGIVYLDPTDLTTTCTSSDVTTNYTENGTNGLPTGIKTGCMKFYIYDDSGDTYKMILDHNTTAKVAYETSGTYKEYDQATIKSTVDSDTTGWQGSPRLITAQEIVTITNTTTFDGSSDTWFFFNGTGDNKQTRASSSQGDNEYAWLFDYTKGCEELGCNTADSSTWGYWTNSPVSGEPNSAWRVFSNGGLYTFDVGRDGYYGVRPVITIDKSILN